MVTSATKRKSKQNISSMEIAVGTATRPKPTRNISIVSEDSATTVDDETDSLDENLRTNSRSVQLASSVRNSAKKRHSPKPTKVNQNMQARRRNQDNGNDDTGGKPKQQENHEQSSSGDDTSGYQTALETESNKSSLSKLPSKSTPKGTEQNEDTNKNYRDGDSGNKPSIANSPLPASDGASLKRTSSSRASAGSSHSLRKQSTSGLNCPVCNMNFPALRYADAEALERAMLTHVTRCSAASVGVNKSSQSTPSGGRSVKNREVPTTNANASTHPIETEMDAASNIKVAPKPASSPTQRNAVKPLTKRKSPPAKTSQNKTKPTKKTNSIPLSDFFVGARFDLLRVTVKGRSRTEKIYPASQVVDVDLKSPKKRVKIHYARCRRELDEWINIDSPRIRPNSLPHLNVFKNHEPPDGCSKSGFKTCGLKYKNSCQNTNGNEAKPIATPGPSKEGERNTIPLSHFVIGAKFDVIRTGLTTKTRIVYGCSVVDVDLKSQEKRVKIHFQRMRPDFDEWIAVDSPRIMPCTDPAAPTIKTKDDSIPLSQFVVGARFDVLRATHTGKLHEKFFPACLVVDVDMKSPIKRVKIRFSRLRSSCDEWIPVPSSRIRPNSLPHLNGAPVHVRLPPEQSIYQQKREMAPTKKCEVAPTKKRKLVPTVAETTANEIPTAVDSLTQPIPGASSMQSDTKTYINMPTPDSVASAIIPKQDHNIKGNEGVKVPDSGHLLNQTWWRKEKKKRSKPTGKKRSRTTPFIPFDLKSCIVKEKESMETVIETKFASSWDHDYVSPDKNNNGKSTITFKDNDVHVAAIGGSNVTITESPFASTACSTEPVAAVENSIVHSTRTRGSRRLRAQAKFKSEDELKLRCPQCQRVFSATWMDMTEESMSRHIARCQKRIEKNIENDLLGSAIHHAKEAAAASSKVLASDNCGDSVSDLSGDSRRRSSPMTARIRHRKRIIISARRSPSENAAIRAERARSIRGVFVDGEQRQALGDIVLRDASASTGDV